MRYRWMIGTAALTLVAVCQVGAIAGLFDNVFKKLPVASPEAAVTTGIGDALPVAHWLDWESGERTPEQSKTFDLSPGYYRMRIRSYCLHAGTYGPTQGDGYLLAPLKGGKAGVIRSILQHSADHPEIQQQDVQELIWDIEAGARYQDLPPDFAARVAPLLSPKDIASLNVDTSSIIDKMLPADVKNAMAFYNSFRQKLIDPTSSYQDLEKVAVLTGKAPWGKDSLKDVPAGNWAYAGNGFFVRSFPESYPTTDIEVIRPANYRMERDSKGRIIDYQCEGYHTQATYDDAPGQDIVPGHPDLHIWRFKTLHFAGPDPGEDYTITGKGWVVPDDACTYDLAGKTHGAEYYSGVSRLADDTQAPSFSDEPTVEEYQYRIRTNLAIFQELKDYVNKCGKHKAGYMSGDSPIRLAGHVIPSFGDIGSQKNFNDGMKAATNPTNLKGKLKWIGHNSGSVSDGWNQASGALAGQNSNGHNGRLDPSSNVSAPANTANQRLGMSGFSK